MQKKMVLNSRDLVESLLVKDIDSIVNIGLFYHPHPVFYFHLVLTPYEISKQNHHSLGGTSALY